MKSCNDVEPADDLEAVEPSEPEVGAMRAPLTGASLDAGPGCNSDAAATVEAER